MLLQTAKGMQYLSVLLVSALLMTFLLTDHSYSRFTALFWLCLGGGVLYGVSQGLLSRWDG
jgi:hypothetical protein